MNHSNTKSPRQIALASLAAAGVAAVILVTLVLPAEFNVDPLGTGKLLGIAGMSEEQLVGALNLQNAAYHEDIYSVTLAPFESLEYKYRLAEGGTLLFNWRADGELLFDMHSEQDGVDPRQFAPTFSKGTAASQGGSFTAPFSGIHGWFWENRGNSTVTLTLQASGFFPSATEFKRGFEFERKFAEAAANE